MKKFITMATVVAMFVAGSMMSADAFAKPHKKHHKKHKAVAGAHQTVNHTPGTARHTGGATTK